ncbi:MAG: hypothetical protein KC486_34975, partial [Myxococcales bacterium]|nr:hypothetical protein [Myxococcales bacterium]
EEVEHRWSRARAQFVLGRILRRAEAPDPQATVARLEAAANDAIADRDRLLAIEALHEAARAAVLLVPDAAEAGSLLRRAEAELAALDGLPRPLGPQLRASQHDIRGLIDYEGGAYEAAREAHRAAIGELRGLAEAGELDDEGRRLLAAAYLNLSRALDDARARERALDEAHALMIQLYGEGHPQLAIHLYSQGLAAFHAGRPVLARELAEASLLLALDAGSGAPLQTARAELLLSQLNLHRGDFEAALRLATYAEERLPAPRGNDFLQARRLRALSLRSLDRHAEAERIEELLVAQASEDASLGADDRADILLDRARGKIDEERYDDALHLIDTLERGLGGAPLPASGLAIRGWALARAGREAEAIFPLEKGIERLTAGYQQSERALSEWTLAEALIAVDGDRRRICELFAASRVFYSAQEGSEATTAELDDLLAEQGCSPPDTNPPTEAPK